MTALGQLTEKEREFITTEMQSHFRLSDRDELSTQRLTEFMRVFTPTGAMELALERQQENRDLYQGLGIGAISPPSTIARTPVDDHRVARVSSAAPNAPTLPVGLLPPPPHEVATSEFVQPDTPDFETF